VLTEGASEELEELRSAESLTEAKLALLIDALESGAASFDSEQRRLARASLQSGTGSSTFVAPPPPPPTAEEEPLVANAIEFVRQVQRIPTHSKLSGKEPVTAK